MPFDSCPNCGADLPRNAKVCPECGSDEKTGWSSEAQISGLNLPGDDDFDYDDFVENEFGGKSVKPKNIHWGWWIVAVILLAVLVVPILLVVLRK